MIATFQTTRIALLALAAALLVGNVASAKWPKKPSKIFSLDSTWPFRDKDAPQEGTPTRMVCTWTDTVMTQPGTKPQRGFGGRIMFYERDEKKPILVDGQLIVYAFDETDRDPTDNKPTRRYVFPADQIPLHMSKNEFGASYSFFLPWDEAGGPRTEISLICRFQPTSGSVIASEQSRLALPGSMVAAAGNGPPKPPKLPDGVPSQPAQLTLQTLQQQRNEQHQAQQAIYEAAAPAGQPAGLPGTAADVAAAPPRQMTSTTINLPNNFQMPSAGSLMTPPSPSATPQPQYIQVPVMQQPLPPQPSASTRSPQMVQQASYTAAMPSAPPNPAMPPRSSYSTTPGGQTPMMQQQAQHLAQQANLQQQLLQQQAAQHQALQQRMLQPQIPVQPSAGQLPMQPMGAATVGYPTMR